MSLSQLILLTVLHHHLLFTFAPSFSYPLAYLHYPPFLTPLIIRHCHTFYYPPFLTSFIIFHSSHILLSSILHTSYSPFYTNFIIPHSHTFYYPPLLTHFITLHSSHILLSSTPRTSYFPPLLTHFIILHSSQLLLPSTPHTFYYPPLLAPFIILHSSHVLLSSTPQTTYYPQLHPHLLSSIPRTFYYPPYFTHFITLHSSHLLHHLFLTDLLSPLLLPLITFSPSLSLANTLYVQFFYPFRSLPSLSSLPSSKRTHVVPPSLPLFLHDVQHNTAFYNYLPSDVGRAMLYS